MATRRSQPEVTSSFDHATCLQSAADAAPNPTIRFPCHWSRRPVVLSLQPPPLGRESAPAASGALSRRGRAHSACITGPGFLPSMPSGPGQAAGRRPMGARSHVAGSSRRYTYNTRAHHRRSKRWAPQWQGAADSGVRVCALPRRERGAVTRGKGDSWQHRTESKSRTAKWVSCTDCDLSQVC